STTRHIMSHTSLHPHETRSKHPDAKHQQQVASFSYGECEFMDSCEHHLSPQRRHAARIEANRRSHLDTEAAHIIGFARKWAPFGGASEEETLVHFGMTAHRFIDRLWQVIAESDYAEDELPRLASVYPPRERSLVPSGDRNRRQ
ncbi:hypothetical protein, partial [Rhodococcus opacus]